MRLLRAFRYTVAVVIGLFVALSIIATVYMHVGVQALDEEAAVSYTEQGLREIVIDDLGEGSIEAIESTNASCSNVTVFEPLPFDCDDVQQQGFSTVVRPAALSLYQGSAMKDAYQTAQDMQLRSVVALVFSLGLLILVVPSISGSLIAVGSSSVLAGGLLAWMQTLHIWSVRSIPAPSLNIGEEAVRITQMAQYRTVLQTMSYIGIAILAAGIVMIIAGYLYPGHDRLEDHGRTLNKDVVEKALGSGGPGNSGS